MLPQRKAGTLCFEIPTGGLNGSFGHAMTAHRLHQGKTFAAFGTSFPTPSARETPQRGPRRFRPFVAIERLLASGAFPPALEARSVGYTGQQDAPFRGATSLFRKS